MENKKIKKWYFYIWRGIKWSWRGFKLDRNLIRILWIDFKTLRKWIIKSRCMPNIKFEFGFDENQFNLMRDFYYNKGKDITELFKMVHYHTGRIGIFEELPYSNGWIPFYAIENSKKIDEIFYESLLKLFPYEKEFKDKRIDYKTFIENFDKRFDKHMFLRCMEYELGLKGNFFIRIFQGLLSCAGSMPHFDNKEEEHNYIRRNTDLEYSPVFYKEIYYGKQDKFVLTVWGKFCQNLITVFIVPFLIGILLVLLNYYLNCYYCQ